MYNTEDVHEQPALSGEPCFDPEAAKAWRGKDIAYDSPIYIADAALYLKATQPDLGIDNVYELDQDQFDAARGRPAEGSSGRTSASTR